MEAMSATCRTSIPNATTITDTTASAMRVASDRSGRTSRASAQTATVAAATTVLAGSQEPTWATQSAILPTVLDDSGSYAVASPSTPATICTAMPVVKPVITALDTNPMIEPSRSTPNSTMTAPTRMTSIATLAGSAGSSPVCSSTLREDSAMALVKVVTISTVRLNSDPTTVGTIPE